MNQMVHTAKLPSLLHALASLAKRNKFHEKVMLGIITILGLSAVTMLGFGSFMDGTDRVVILVGGALFVVMIFLPYNKIQALRKQNIMISMVVGVINRLKNEVSSETLDKLVKELLQYSLRR